MPVISINLQLSETVDTQCRYTSWQKCAFSSDSSHVIMGSRRNTAFG